MKRKNVKPIIIAIAFVLPFSVSQAQSGHPQDAKAEGHALHQKQTGSPVFKDKKIETAYQHYLHIQTALVASEVHEAQKGAEMLAASLKALDHATEAQQQAGKIAQASSLEKQREAFVALSNAMVTLVEGSIVSGEVYQAYCPMANNNQGAYWLASEQEIKNPYFGDKMLQCGSVEKTLQ